MELFEDYRFLCDLNETQKLLYLILLGLAGKTNNKIRNDIEFIKSRMNLKSITEKDLEKISEVFPKFKLSKDYWYFENFEEHHNWYEGSTKGVPKEAQNRIDKKRKDIVSEVISEEFEKLPLKTKIYPTKEEAVAFFTAEGLPEEGVNFWTFYEMRGWVQGASKIPIKKWKMAAARWIHQNRKETKDPYANLPRQVL